MYIRILLSLALAMLVAGIAPAAFAQQLLYIHADHLNTPRLVTSGSGTPVWRWDQTEPFGDNLPNEDPDGNSILGHLPLRFPGQYFDKETGLAYNMARDYDLGLGRYIQSDPIGLMGGLNLYAYVEGNPLGNADPSGNMSAAGAAAAAGATTLALICVSDPKCRQQAACLLKYLADIALCTYVGICPSGDQEATMACFRRAAIAYRACIRGWPRPYDDLYPGPTS